MIDLSDSDDEIKAHVDPDFEDRVAFDRLEQRFTLQPYLENKLKHILRAGSSVTLFDFVCEIINAQANAKIPQVGMEQMMRSLEKLHLVDKGILPSFKTIRNLCVDKCLPNIKRIPICVNWCIAFYDSPFTVNGDSYKYADCEVCPQCQQDKLNANGKPRRTLFLIPIGDLIDVLFSRPDLVSKFVRTPSGSLPRGGDGFEMWKDIYDTPGWEWTVHQHDPSFGEDVSYTLPSIFCFFYFTHTCNLICTQLFTCIMQYHNVLLQWSSDGVPMLKKKSFWVFMSSVVNLPPELRAKSSNMFLNAIIKGTPGNMQAIQRVCIVYT